MTTYTLPIPEGLAADIATLSPEKVNAVNIQIAELLADFLEEQHASERHGYPLTAEDLDAIGRGLTEADNGQVKSGVEFLSELRDKYNVK